MKKVLLIIFVLFNFKIANAAPVKFWKVGDDYLTPKCFVYEWMSSDNLKVVYEEYSKKLPKNEKFKFSKIGSYYEEYIPLEHSFTPKGGNWEKQSLTRYLKDCANKKPVTYLENKDNSFIKYEVVENSNWRNPKTACRILSPYIRAKCLDIKTVKFTEGFSGSMPPVSQTNIYGVYELQNKTRIILPLSFKVSVPKPKEVNTVLRGDFFPWVSSQTQHNNMNSLYFDNQFKAYVKKTYPEFSSKLDYSMEGPGDPLNYNDNKRYVWGSACRSGECGMSKSLMWLDTKEKKSIAMTVSYTSGYGKIKEDFSLSIASNDYNEIPKEFITAVKTWLVSTYSYKKGLKPTRISFKKKDSDPINLNLNIFN